LEHLFFELYSKCQLFVFKIIGTALLTMSGGPVVEGSTIDTASQDGKVLDKWAQGSKDVILPDKSINLYCFSNFSPFT